MKVKWLIIGLILVSVFVSAYIFHEDSSIYVNSENSDAVAYLNDLKTTDYNLEQSLSSFIPFQENNLDFNIYYGHKTDEIVVNFKDGSYKLYDLIDYFQKLINKKYEMMKSGQKGDLKELVEFNYKKTELPNPGHNFEDISLEGDQQILTIYNSITQETCVDGIQNQEEASIDCGGSCGACKSEERWYPRNPACNGGGSSTLTIPEGAAVANAVVKRTYSDDKILLYINGNLVYDEPITCNPGNHYKNDLNIQIGQYLVPGKNTIRADASCPCDCGTSNACALIEVSYYE